MGWSDVEWAGADIWDERCRKTLSRASERLADQSGVSLSSALGSTRKAISGIFHSRKVTDKQLLSGHIEATVTRCREYGEEHSPHFRPHPFVLIASDTTTADFTTHKAVADLGPVSNKKHQRGFLAHSALAMTPTGVPLGVIYQNSWARDSEQTNIAKDRRKRLYPDKESYKWLEALRGVEAVLPPDIPALLIQDREADIFEFFSAPRQSHIHLLIRATQPRRIEVSGLDSQAKTLLDAIAQAPVVAGKTVAVHGRPDREARDAALTVRLMPMRIRAPLNGDDPKAPSVPVFVVRACEENPAPGVKEPVSWVLLTTLPDVDASLALQLIDYYALRWRIERFHFVLKSGCGYEKLQCDTLEALQKALCLYSIVAWHLLWMTYLVREEPDAPAERVISETEKKVLELSTGKEIHTARDAMMAVAKIAGFVSVPSAPLPGVKTLWIGWTKLQDMVTGFLIATQALNPKSVL